jgi:hypothetical protein
MNQELKAYQEELRKEYAGKAFMRPTVNTILTFVVRMNERIVITMDGKEYDIQWNPMYAEPEVIEPGTTAINIRGIVDVSDWLRSLPTGASFYTAKPIKGRLIDERV